MLSLRAIEEDVNEASERKLKLQLRSPEAGEARSRGGPCAFSRRGSQLALEKLLETSGKQTHLPTKHATHLRNARPSFDRPADDLRYRRDIFSAREQEQAGVVVAETVKIGSSACWQ